MALGLLIMGSRGTKGQLAWKKGKIMGGLRMEVMRMFGIRGIIKLIKMWIRIIGNLEMNSAMLKK